MKQTPLEKAHAELKKEVRKLRSENAKLRNGTFTDQEKQELLDRIKHLEHDLLKSNKERDRYHELWQHAARYNRKCPSDFLIRIEDLEKSNADLTSTNQSLSEQLRDALELISKLKTQMNRDHENSSIPSSQKPIHKKIKNSRVKTDRKPGGQKGHSGHKRPHMEPTVPVVDIAPTPEMLSDTDLYPTDEFITKQKIDISISANVTEYRARVYRSGSTGKRVHAPFPDGVVNEFNYGENVKALAFLLNNYCNVSIDKTSEIISGITSGAVTMSKGLISSLPKRFSAATEDDRKHIYSMLLLAPSMHVDFTPGRVNGKAVQVIFCGNDNEVMYLFREHKGHAGIEGSPVEEYQQILIHDHDTTFYSYGGGHQECLSHILRYLQDAIENEPDLTWHQKMRDLLKSTIHEVKQNRNLPAERIDAIRSAYENITDEGEKEYEEHPPGKYYPDGSNLLKRMRKYKDSHLLFLSHPEIDYTNNLAERGLRKFKRKLKQAVTFRSNSSVINLCNCLSVIETGRMRGTDIYKTAVAAFSQ